MKKMTIATANPVTFKFYEFFFYSTGGGPTDGQALGKKNKLWEASGNWIKKNHFPVLVPSLGAGGGGVTGVCSTKFNSTGCSVEGIVIVDLVV